MASLVFGKVSVNSEAFAGKGGKEKFLKFAEGRLKTDKNLAWKEIEKANKKGAK